MRRRLAGEIFQSADVMERAQLERRRCALDSAGPMGKQHVSVEAFVKCTVRALIDAYALPGVELLKKKLTRRDEDNEDD